MNASPLLETLPDALLDSTYMPPRDFVVNYSSHRLYAALVSCILRTCPTLAVALLSAFGKRVHASAVRVLFTSIILPDDARYFFAFNAPHLVPGHPLSAILMNPDRYARTVKQISVTDAGLPPPSEALESEGSLGLIMIDEDDSDTQVSSKHSRIAVQPMPAMNLHQLLALCTSLEGFIWRSSNPPPDGVCEVCLTVDAHPFCTNISLRFSRTTAHVF